MTSTSDETTLVLTRIFDAAPDSVFDAWLNREEWAAWIGPEGVKCEVPLLEPHVGGRYSVTMRFSGGQEIPVAGVFKTIDRPNLLVFTWGWDNDPSRQSLISLTFNKKGRKTELVLRQEGLGSVTNRDQHEKGWNGTLNKLDGYLATRLPTTVN